MAAYTPTSPSATCFVVKPLAVFSNLQAVEVPNDWFGSISPQLWGIINYSNTLTIRQHVKLLPKDCCSCLPCVKQGNTYSVYAGLNQDSETEFLRLDEVSDDCNRCCCSPYHPLKLEARQYIPLPVDNSASDYSHLKEDVVGDFQRLTKPKDKQTFTKNLYKSQPVLFSIIRDDGMRCCAFPCKCLSTFVCCGCCQDGVHVYAGDVPKERQQELGRYKNPPISKLIGSAIQPVFGGWCGPTIHLRGEKQADTEQPFGKIEGPCCFGGWSEMCFDFKFFTSWFNSPTKTGDVALITKKKPTSLAAGVRELMSDSDVYTIQFGNDNKLSASQKISVLAGQVLADYMYFDGNTEKCKVVDDGIYCYFFYCSVIGCLWPCYICIPPLLQDD